MPSEQSGRGGSASDVMAQPGTTACCHPQSSIQDAYAIREKNSSGCWWCSWCLAACDDDHSLRGAEKGLMSNQVKDKIAT